MHLHTIDKVILHLFLCISCFMQVDIKDIYLQSQAWVLD